MMINGAVEVITASIVAGLTQHAALHPLDTLKVRLQYSKGVPMSTSVRGALGDASEIITSTKKMGGPGATLTLPLTSKKSIWDFDHMDAAEITIPDAPHADEIVVILALAMGGRPRKRIKPD